MITEPKLNSETSTNWPNIFVVDWNKHQNKAALSNWLRQLTTLAKVSNAMKRGRQRNTHWPHLVQACLSNRFQPSNLFTQLGWCKTHMTKLFPFFNRCSHHCSYLAADVCACSSLFLFFPLAPSSSCTFATSGRNTSVAHGSLDRNRFYALLLREWAAVLIRSTLPRRAIKSCTLRILLRYSDLLTSSYLCIISQQLYLALSQYVTKPIKLFKV